MMKLLFAGLGMIALGLGFVLFTNLDPTTLFIGGVLCSLIAVLDIATPSYGRGEPVSAGSVTDAQRLANLRTYGSPVGDPGGVFNSSEP